MVERAVLPIFGELMVFVGKNKVFLGSMCVWCGYSEVSGYVFLLFVGKNKVILGSMCVWCGYAEVSGYSFLLFVNKNKGNWIVFSLRNAFCR